MDASRSPATLVRPKERRKTMKLDMLAIDIGKRSFQIHGIDADGCIVSRKISRGKLAITVEQLDPQIVFIEACGSAHHWGRLFQASGREVRLVNPYFVRPFVRGSRNDAADAEAIWDAATRPSMRFVPVKTLDQQDLQSLHRMRDRLVRARTSLINHTRGLLAEYGIVLPKGAARFSKSAPDAVASADLSALAQELFLELIDQLEDLDRRIARIDGKLVAISKEHPACRSLATMPGIGPVIATALVAAIDSGQHFRSGRDLAAWIGLIPRQYTTGGIPRLGGIGRRANHYLRRQLIHGARAVVSRVGQQSGERADWIRGLLMRRGFNRTVVALANKMARAAWAMLTRQEQYRIA
jgi:transposase